jgi:hypothetical protein
MSSSPPLPSYRRIETLEFSKSIPSSILDDICPSRLKSTSTFHAVKHTREATKKNCLGKPILDLNHPAYPAYGLFASRKLSSLERVIDYHGFVTLNGEEDKESDYTYSFAKRRLVIDANAVGTEARFCKKAPYKTKKKRKVCTPYRVPFSDRHIRMRAYIHVL